MGPKTEKDLLLKVWRQKRGTVSREVSRECSVLFDKQLLLFDQDILFWQEPLCPRYIVLAGATVFH